MSPPYARTFADVTPSRPFWYKKSKKKKGGHTHTFEVTWLSPLFVIHQAR